MTGRALAGGRRQGCSHRAPGAELGTRGRPVMHILLTHVGMSQSPRGRGLTQRQAERRGELGLCADGGDRLLLLTASLGKTPAPVGKGIWKGDLELTRSPSALSEAQCKCYRMGL